MDRTLFTNVTVLDCTGAQPYAGEVLIEGNRIKQLAKAAKPLPRQGARVVDGGGATLMPGLIEAHGHISFCDTPTWRGWATSRPRNTR
jgi:Imidazolonepropionase and related amidohydrolases